MNRLHDSTIIKFICGLAEGGQNEDFVQLHCIITLVYKDTALKTVNKEAFRGCVKSLLKKLKMFTDKERDTMFA